MVLFALIQEWLVKTSCLRPSSLIKSTRKKDPRVTKASPYLGHFQLEIRTRRPTIELIRPPAQAQTQGQWAPMRTRLRWLVSCRGVVYRCALDSFGRLHTAHYQNGQSLTCPNNWCLAEPKNNLQISYINILYLFIIIKKYRARVPLFSLLEWGERKLVLVVYSLLLRFCLRATFRKLSTTRMGDIYYISTNSLFKIYYYRIATLASIIKMSSHKMAY